MRNDNMRKNDNINSFERLNMYKKLSENIDKYLLYLPEIGFDSSDVVSEADVFRIATDFSKVAITAFADTIELKGGDIKDMSLGLCFYPYVNKEDTLLNGFLTDNPRALKNYLGIMITDISGHYNSGEKFLVDDSDELKIIDGTIYPVNYTDFVLGFDISGFELTGADDFNEICKTAFSDKVPFGKVSYGIEKEKVMIKSDR
jgi:hypothetical protein